MKDAEIDGGDSGPSKYIPKESKCHGDNRCKFANYIEWQHNEYGIEIFFDISFPSVCHDGVVLHIQK